MYFNIEAYFDIGGGKVPDGRIAAAPQPAEVQQYLEKWDNIRYHDAFHWCDKPIPPFKLLLEHSSRQQDALLGSWKGLSGWN
jgi:hypothetical protein